MTFHIITLFPRAFDSYLDESILKRAIEDKKIKVKFYNPRDFTKDKRRIDMRPYGGGPGMVIQAEPVIKAIEAALRSAKLRAKNYKLKAKIIWLGPSGKQFTNQYAKKFVRKHTNIIIICGRYEGIDARVKKVFKADEVSVGPFILTGGELPAMIMIDVIARQVRGVLGDFSSLEETRVASPDVYTRPEKFMHKKQSYRVPKILLSGRHADIETWKKRRHKL